MTCRTIRAEAHPASKHALANIRPSATAFLIICAVWSGTDAQRIYTHSLQHHSEIHLEAILKSFCLVCAQTWSKNRSGQFFNIALLTIYNTFLCRLALPSHLHLPIRPICAQKFPTFFLFFYLGCFTQEREPCTLQPLHTRTLIHSPQLSHPPTS